MIAETASWPFEKPQCGRPEAMAAGSNVAKLSRFEQASGPFKIAAILAAFLAANSSFGPLLTEKPSILWINEGLGMLLVSTTHKNLDASALRLGPS